MKRRYRKTRKNIRYAMIFAVLGIFLIIATAAMREIGWIIATVIISGCAYAIGRRHAYTIAKNHTTSMASEVMPVMSQTPQYDELTNQVTDALVNLGWPKQASMESAKLAIRHKLSAGEHVNIHTVVTYILQCQGNKIKRIEP